MREIEFEYTQLRMLRAPDRHRRQVPAALRHGVQGDRPGVRAGPGRRQGAGALDLAGGKIAINEAMQTSLKGVFAGGDCTATGIDSRCRASRTAAGGDLDRSIPARAARRKGFMADIRSNFIGIKSPNPFWLASAPPTDKEYNVVRAFKAGWGGVVWKTLGENPPVVNVSSRYGALHYGDDRMIGFNNIELITDRPLEVNLREIKQVKRDWPDRAGHHLVDGPLRGGELEEHPKGHRGYRRRRDRAQFRLPARHVGARHGFGGGPGAGICRHGGALVQAAQPDAGDRQADAQRDRHRKPARAAKEGGADAVSLINTINSITSIDLDIMAPTPTVDGKGTHGGYCGPAVKPIALHMVADIARDPETAACRSRPSAASPTGAMRRSSSRLSAGTVQVRTAAMHYGFRIVDDMATGLSNWMDQGLPDDRGFPRQGGAQRHRLAVPQHQLQVDRPDRPGQVHPMRPLPHRLRGHLAPVDRGETGRRASGAMR